MWLETKNKLSYCSATHGVLLQWIMMWRALLLMGCLAASSASASGSAGLIPATVPTQVIIQFTENPAALNLPPGSNVVPSNQRSAFIASASASATAEQASFRVAAAGVAYQTDRVYKQVSLYCY